MTTNISLDAEKMKRAVAVRSLTIGRLAELAGVSAPTVRRALDGNPVQAEKARKIIRAIQSVEPDPLLEEFAA